MHQNKEIIHGNDFSKLNNIIPGIKFGLGKTLFTQYRTEIHNIITYTVLSRNSNVRCRPAWMGLYKNCNVIINLTLTSDRSFFCETEWVKSEKCQCQQQQHVKFHLPIKTVLIMVCCLPFFHRAKTRTVSVIVLCHKRVKGRLRYRLLVFLSKTWQE